MKSYAIAAGMNSELGSHGNSGTKQEEDIDEIEDKRNATVAREGRFEADQYQVEQ